MPPLPSQPSVNTNPANIFAQMKSGTFAQDDNASQSSDKYDALRPNRELSVFVSAWRIDIPLQQPLSLYNRPDGEALEVRTVTRAATDTSDRRSLEDLYTVLILAVHYSTLRLFGIFSLLGVRPWGWMNRKHWINIPEDDIIQPCRVIR